MARTMTKKQKALLDKAHNRGATCWDDLTPDEWDEIEGIRDYETLWMDAERYLMDKALADIYGVGAP